MELNRKTYPEDAIADALRCLEAMTTEEFARGGDRRIRDTLGEALSVIVNADHEEALVHNEIIKIQRIRKMTEDAEHARKPLAEKHDELVAHVVKLVNECAASLGFHCLLKMEGYQLVGPRKNWKVEIRTAYDSPSTMQRPYPHRDDARIIISSTHYNIEGRATFKIKDDGSFNAPGVARRILDNLGLLEEVA